MNVDYHALAPEIVLAVTVIAVLFVDMLPVQKFWTAVVGLTGLFVTVPEQAALVQWATFRSPLVKS